MSGGDILVWGAVIAALANILVIAKMFIDAGVTKQKADTAAKSAHEAHQRIDRLTENSATVGDIAAAEKRFADAVAGMRADFQHMAGRLDGLLTAVLQGKA